MTVAVIGTGRMGSAMARRLTQAGLDVRLWNRSSDKAQALADDIGAVACSSPAEAVESCSVVLVVLANAAATQATMLDAQFMASLDPHAVACDMGTSGPDTARAIGTAYREAGLRCVDSPVSGSVPSVLSGSLLVMAGGAKDDIRDAEPALLTFAKSVRRVGPTGAGQSMKLAVTLIVHALNGAVAEGLALAERSGITRDAAYSVLLESSVAAPYVGYKREAFVADTSPVAMSIALVAKDLGLIHEQAREHDLRLPILEATRHEADQAQASGYAASDMADIVRFLLAEPPPQRPSS